MKRFLFAAFLATVLCLSAVLAFLATAVCLSAMFDSSASTSTPSSSWAGKHRFTLIVYQRGYGSTGTGIAVVKNKPHNTFCSVGLKRDHHLSPGAVFTTSIAKGTKVTGDKKGSICSYSEWDTGQLPVKVVGHVSTITVQSVIENMPPESALAFAPNKYLFDWPSRYTRYGPDMTVSYSARAAKAVHRAEDSGKAVTVRIKISKGGLRHMGFVH